MAKRGLLILDVVEDIKRRNQILSAIASKESIGFEGPRDFLMAPMWRNLIFGKKRGVAM